MTRQQLLALGFSKDWIDHRISKGRLHPVWGGVYAVGRPSLTVEGRWMAAVLACGPGAVLSHGSAAALWRFRPRLRRIESSVPNHRSPRPRGVVVHRRVAFGPPEVVERDGIPVTSPISTLIDIASRLTARQLEAAVNEADKLDLTDPDALRSALDETPRRPGVARLRVVLDRRTFVLTRSELERRFLPIARRAGLPQPLTGESVNGFDVDFYWPELGLVVETDGLRYHRTPAAQARDRLRDQVHTAAGLTPLRFTHDQIRFEPKHVEATLAAVADRLSPAD